MPGLGNPVGGSRRRDPNFHEDVCYRAAGGENALTCRPVEACHVLCVVSLLAHDSNGLARGMSLWFILEGCNRQECNT